MHSSTSIKAYRHQSLEGSVASANPHQLILLLFEGARTALAIARRGIEHKDAKTRGEAISRAMAIIDDGLNASLDIGHGGELAERLRGLYEYMNMRLALANLRNDGAIVDEVDRLLAELEGAWRQIGNPAPAEAPRARAPAPQPHASISYGKA